MKLPALKDFEFTPLIWKECIVKGSYLKTKQEIYDTILRNKMLAGDLIGVKRL